MCSKDLHLKFLDFNKTLHQKFHYWTHIQRNQPKGSSINKVNFPSPVLLLIQFHFNHYISQVSDIKFQVLLFFICLARLLQPFYKLLEHIHIKYLVNYNNMENTIYSKVEKNREEICRNTERKEFETLIFTSTETLNYKKIILE